ncbi:YobH family protein [Enterobacter kobei]|uniref:YobH family protein n=1 Tax=Enterobacter kobei TaxID=208224 RepID=UPI001F5BCFE5|nr:YobH family protein [Enterobacter kobei]
MLISESAWEEMTCLFAPSLGIQCKYVTAQGVSTAQYLHSDSGIIGLTNCPVLRKMSVVVDNG